MGVPKTASERQEMQAEEPHGGPYLNLNLLS